MNTPPPRTATPFVFAEKAEVFLITKVYRQMPHFRRYENYFLKPQMKETMAKIISTAYLANTLPQAQRLGLYRQLDARLKYMATLVKIAKSTGGRDADGKPQLTPGMAADWQRDLNEMGRILGGLIKRAKEGARP